MRSIADHQNLKVKPAEISVSKKMRRVIHIGLAGFAALGFAVLLMAILHHA